MPREASGLAEPDGQARDGRGTRQREKQRPSGERGAQDPRPCVDPERVRQWLGVAHPSSRDHGGHHGEHAPRGENPQYGTPARRWQPAVREEQQTEQRGSYGRNVKPVQCPGGDHASGEEAGPGEHNVVRVPGQGTGEFPAQTLREQQPANRIARQTRGDIGTHEAEAEKRHRKDGAVIQVPACRMSRNVERHSGRHKRERETEKRPGEQRSRPNAHEAIFHARPSTGNSGGSVSYASPSAWPFIGCARWRQERGQRPPWRRGRGLAGGR
jgi:hypothetical protein